MRNRAVVLTYPAHFLLTQLTLRSISRYFPEVGEISIIVDDLSDLAWPRYVEDCRSVYPGAVRPLSDWPEYGEIQIPWVRQQTVKLHLDAMLGWDDFFFSDGDIVFDCHVPEDIIPYNYIDFNDQDSAQARYVAYMLGRPFKNIKIEERAVITSNAAFRDLRSSWLEALRSYVFQIHKDSIFNIHRNIKDYQGVSEWEMLEFFKAEILGIKPKLSTYYCQSLATPTENTDPQFFTCWCSDRYFDQSWWSSQGIDTDAIWRLLPSDK